MDNPLKIVRALNKRTREITDLTRSRFDIFQSKSNDEWEIQGYIEPSDVVHCWYVSEDEKVEAIKKQRWFCEGFSTLEYFKLANRIDNTFIEGYLGKDDLELSFFEDFIPTLAYFIDHIKRKKSYFTFDRVTLYQVIEIMPYKPLKFILKRLDKLKMFTPNQAFMIMPFHDPILDKFYFECIKPFLKDKLNIDIYRADDFRDNDIIINTIYSKIEESEFILADTTWENKNSFYELGYASAMGKEIITIQDKQTEQKLFFDRAHIRSILYNMDDISTFQFELESTINSIRSRA